MSITDAPQLSNLESSPATLEEPAVVSTQNPPNPISFAAFRHAVLTQPPDQLYRYHDEDGEEVDLEETYDGSASERSQDEDDQASNLSDADVSDCDKDGDDASIWSDDDAEAEQSSFRSMPSSTATPGARQPAQKYSQFRDPVLAKVIEETYATLNDLSLRAQPILDEQPLSTQIALTNQTAELFRNYARHGSEARLFEAIGKFLNAGDELREVNSTEAAQHVGSGQKNLANRKGTKLRCAPADSVKEMNMTQARQSLRAKTKRKAEGENVSDDEEAGIGRLAKRRTPVNTSKLSISASHDNGVARNVPASKDTVTPHCRAAGDFLPKLGRSLENETSPVLETVSLPSEIHSNAAPTHNPNTYSVTTDLETNALLPSLPFAPCGLDISWKNPSLSWPPGLLDHLNRIFHLYNREAAFLLSYFTKKYTLPSSAAATAAAADTVPDPPHALFRQGISEHLNSQLETILEPASGHFLGLQPEIRRLFRECFIYEKRSLNSVELEIMARMGNVDIETVKKFWDDQMLRTRAWEALRIWCARRDSEKLAKAKREGSF